MRIKDRAKIFFNSFGPGIVTGAAVQMMCAQIARALKWLALFLFSYIIVVFMVEAHWNQILRDTFVPSLPHSKSEWSMLVAILGTTISPYLFFWRASQEVEEEKNNPKHQTRAQCETPSC